VLNGMQVCGAVYACIPFSGVQEIFRDFTFRLLYHKNFQAQCCTLLYLVFLG
jgi:hypothetical protein